MAGRGQGGKEMEIGLKISEYRWNCREYIAGKLQLKPAKNEKDDLDLFHSWGLPNPLGKGDHSIGNWDDRHIANERGKFPEFRMAKITLSPFLEGGDNIGAIYALQKFIEYGNSSLKSYEGRKWFNSMLKSLIADLQEIRENEELINQLLEGKLYLPKFSMRIKNIPLIEGGIKCT